MNKLYITLLFLTALLACTKEDELTPSGARDNYFTVSPDATDQESVLRREFFEDYGVHLFFNDTLRHEQAGTYADGTPYLFTEVIDLGYALNSVNTEIQFDYLTDYEDQKKAIGLVSEYILSHLSGGMRPYSIFLVKDLRLYEYGGWSIGYDWLSKDYYSGMRCLALNYGKMAELGEEDVESACQDMFYDLIYSRIEHLEIPAFYALCDKNYWRDLTDFGFDKYDNPPTEADIYKLGFLEYSNYWFAFNGEEDDLKSYLRLLLSLKDEDWDDYVIYPIVYQKLEILKELIEELGYKF